MWDRRKVELTFSPLSSSLTTTSFFPQPFVEILLQPSLHLKGKHLIPRPQRTYHFSSSSEGDEEVGSDLTAGVEGVGGVEEEEEGEEERIHQIQVGREHQAHILVERCEGRMRKVRREGRRRWRDEESRLFCCDLKSVLIGRVGRLETNSSRLRKKVSSFATKLYKKAPRSRLSCATDDRKLACLAFVVVACENGSFATKS